MRLWPRLYLDIGWRDLLSIFAPIGGTRAALEARIEAAWPAHAAPALSVRTALDAVLTSLALSRGAAVAMSAVTIQNMADVVRAHGLEPVPVDLEMATLAPNAAGVEQALAASGAKIYIHAHLYGARSDLTDIAAVCRTHGALLIEDSAQGYTGAPPNVLIADVAFYSFGPIKAQTCLGGAVALFADRSRAEAVRAILAAHAPMPERWLRIRAMKYSAFKLLSNPRLYGLAVAGMRARGVDPDKAIGGAARGFSGADLMVALRRSPPRALLRLLAARTSRPRDASWRIRAGAILDKALSGTFERPGNAAPVQACWLYPVLAEEPAAAIVALRAASFDATRGATSLRAITDVSGSAGANASLLIEHVVYLPIAPSMTDGALRRMAEVLRESVRPWRRTPGRIAA